MSNELLTLWDQTQPSVIFVTHDLEEAIALADQVVVMTAAPGTVKASSTSTCPGRAARCRRSGSASGSPSCTTRSGSRCVTRWSGPTRAPPRRPLRRRRPAGERGGTVMTTPRKLWVLVAQVAVLIIVFGGWQLLTSLKIVDPFFFGQPAGSCRQPGTGHSTALTSVDLAADLDHDGGSHPRVPDRGGLRHRRRRAARAGTVPVRLLSPYIKAVNALPRIVLGALFVIILGLGMSSKLVLAAFLVFFVSSSTPTRASRVTKLRQQRAILGARACRWSATWSSRRR